MHISVVMVALNEEEGLAVLLPAIRDEMEQRGLEHEIIVVDGGSSDATREVAARHATVLHSPPGYGRQYLQGFAAARGRVIVTLDADDSYPAACIPPMVERLEAEDLDFLTANRYARMDAGAMPPMHVVGNFVLTSATNLLFGLALADSQSGMWCFRREVLRRLVLTRPGMAFSEEFKIEACRRCRAREVAGCYRPRRGSSKIRTWRDGCANLLFLLARFVEERSGLRLGTGYHAARAARLLDEPILPW